MDSGGKARDDAESSDEDEDDKITVGGINLKVLSLTSNNKEETITTFSVEDRMAAWKGVAADSIQSSRVDVEPLVSRKIGKEDTWIKRKKGRKESSSTKKKQAVDKKEELLAKFNANSQNWISAHKSMTQITPVTNTITDTEQVNNFKKAGRREDLIAQFEANSLSSMKSTGR
jgi:hypothetical protein